MMEKETIPEGDGEAGRGGMGQWSFLLGVMKGAMPQKGGCGTGHIAGNLLEAFYHQTCQEGCWGKLPGAESC